MSLRERLIEKAAAAEREKLAADVFAAAFVDELVKLGYDPELLKQADLSGALNKVKSFLRFPVAKSTPGPITKKIDHLGAIRKVNRDLARAKATPAPQMPAKPAWETSGAKVWRSS